MQGLTALLLNRREGRLQQSGVVVFSQYAARSIMRGETPLSVRLLGDLERPGEYHVSAVHGKKTVFWLPNQLSSFYEAAQGYYAFGGYSLWRQELSFEPRIGVPIYITSDFFLTENVMDGVETITLSAI